MEVGTASSDCDVEEGDEPVGRPTGKPRAVVDDEVPVGEPPGASTEGALVLATSAWVD